MRFLPRLLFTLAVSMMAVSSLAAQTDATGTTVIGSLNFIDHFGPNNGYGDTPYQLRANSFSNPTAVIGKGPEYTLLDTFGCCDTEIAVQVDFTGTTLSIFTLPVQFLDHQFTFTDPAFTGVTYLGTDPDVHTSFSGDTITIDVLSPPQHYKTTFTNEPDVFLLIPPVVTTPVTPPVNPVPEPGSLLLFGTGALAAAVAARRASTRPRFLATGNSQLATVSATHAAD